MNQHGELLFLAGKIEKLPSASRVMKNRCKLSALSPINILVVTEKLRSYGVAHRELIPDVIHDNSQYENNRAEQSHEATRVRERGMRRFKSVRQAQRFLGAHAAVSNLYNLGRHKVGAQHYRELRTSAYTEWSRAVA
jgi:putative transposase